LDLLGGDDDVERRCRGVALAERDGVALDPRAITLDDGGTHEVRVSRGSPSSRTSPAGSRLVLQPVPGGRDIGRTVISLLGKIARLIDISRRMV
jgi:hypothetical protein